MMTTRVDGNNYRMPVNYTLDCRSASANAMKLQVQGNGAAFDGTVLRSEQGGLGHQAVAGEQQAAHQHRAELHLPEQARIMGRAGQAERSDPDGR
ncbi:putative minor fimbrial subunit StfE [Serratia fonticola]|uniref:Putative minor fimbrial subunit StfE n=1 Tax=Serratia fonticola TaxID=47917 RepID=A0A4U9VVQ1_SERFO|nr:putative minor fimbrial subunit StfE [Serratia fonticola]